MTAMGGQAGGHGGWASMEKKSHGWGMAMVGYALIGNMGCIVYRMAMWHLQGVEG